MLPRTWRSGALAVVYGSLSIRYGLKKKNSRKLHTSLKADYGEEPGSYFCNSQNIPNDRSYACGQKVK